MVEDEIISDEDYGPAMSALDDRRRAFVIQLLSQRGKPNYALAARAAGYSSHPGTSRLTGHDLVHQPKVIAALHEESRRRFTLAGWLGVMNLIDLAENKDHPDYYKASVQLADRFGYAAITEHKVSVQHTDLTGQAVIKRIADFAAKHGYDAVKLLGGNTTELQLEARVVEVKADE